MLFRSDHHHNNNSKLFGASIGSFPIMTKQKFLDATDKDRKIYLAIRHPVNMVFSYFSVFLYGMCIQSFLSNFKNVSELTQLYRPMEQLTSMLNDTILLSGSESYVSSLQYYASTKEGSKGNAANAKPIYDDLKKRFEIGRAHV